MKIDAKDKKEKTMEMGDVKAMHEALIHAHQFLHQGRGATVEKWLALVEEINAALSMPVRNCDIGTVDEQLERHRLYCIGLCTAHECDYDLDKHDTETCKKCFAKWAQMKRVEK